MKDFIGLHRSAMSEDRDGAPVFMAKDAWELNYVAGRNPLIRFTATKDRR
jgi:peptide chain release factor 3